MSPDTSGPSSRWSPLDWLLRAWPGEFMPGDEAHRHLAAWARHYAAHPSLRPEERDRIRAVWLDGRHAPPSQLTTVRWAELRRIASDARRTRLPAEAAL